jgi:starch-binding outer membrane protein, SusD/RagB family
MKTIKKLSIILIIALFFSACEDILVEKPKSIMDPSQFFNNDAELIGAVNGIYSRGVNFTFNNGNGSYNYIVTSALGTDLARITGGRENSIRFHAYTLSPSQQGWFKPSWEAFYRTIADANMVINRAEMNRSNFSTEIYNRSIGEAKFLRSFFYYVLTCYFGDVPMWLDELKIAEVSELPRTPISEIRTQMINDLNEAASLLPSSYSGENLGRVNKWAALMLLTKIHMWNENWSEAKASSGRIIDESQHTLMPEYSMIFGKENEYNNEIIWEADFQQDIHKSTRVARFTPRSNDEPQIADTKENYSFNGYATFAMADEFIATFDTEDTRLPWYNLNGVYDDPDGDGIYDRWVNFNYTYCLKGMDPGSPRGNSGLNSIIYRLADAYLLYAEAENELNGPTADAYEKINIIRDRAFGNNPEKRLSSLTKDEFRKAIMDERKWELSFEYQRRWDLIRWGKLEEAVQSIKETNPIGAGNYQPYHVLFPIPFDEIDLNPALTQNTGYE